MFLSSSSGMFNPLYSTGTHIIHQDKNSILNINRLSQTGNTSLRHTPGHTTPRMSVPQSKNIVSTSIKHSRYINLMSNVLSIYFHTKRLYVHMFDIVDIPFSNGTGLIVC